MPNEPETTTQTDQGQTGEAAGAADEARAAAGLKAALLKERRARQELERKLAARLQPGTGEAAGDGGDPDLDALAKLEITEQDLDGEKLPALNAKIRQITQTLVRLGGERKTAARAAEVQAIVDKYGIYQDADADLAADAQQALLAEVAAVDGALDAAKLDAAAAAVARRFSRYKAMASRGDAGGAETGAFHPTAGAGGGGAGAAHVRSGEDAPKTLAEARSLAHTLAARLAQRMGIPY